MKLRRQLSTATASEGFFTLMHTPAERAHKLKSNWKPKIRVGEDWIHTITVDILQSGPTLHRLAPRAEVSKNGKSRVTYWTERPLEKAFCGARLGDGGQQVGDAISKPPQLVGSAGEELSLTLLLGGAQNVGVPLLQPDQRLRCR